MGIKIPGLLKSTAFQTGVVQNLNTRFDKMRENSEAYQTAARKKGQELFKSYKETQGELKALNEAKIYVASNFGAELADYMDTTNQLKFSASLPMKDFLAQVDVQASNIMSSGGVPDDFKQVENPYFGEERFEKLDESYGKVKDFMNKNNDVFGNSFEALMEESIPERMTREQFGVTSREDIISMDRSGLGSTPIKSEDEIKLIKMVDTAGAWKNKGLKMNTNTGVMEPLLIDDKEIQTAAAANLFANQHYRYNKNRTQQGLGTSASIGVATAKNIVGYADLNETADSAMNDAGNIIVSLQTSIPAIAGDATQTQNATRIALSLYLTALQSAKQDPILVRKVRERIEKELGYQIY